jgi:hypothetical protein
VTKPKFKIPPLPKPVKEEPYKPSKEEMYATHKEFE